jgi:hypothetical protein
MSPETQLVIILLIVLGIALYIFFNYHSKPSTAVDAQRQNLAELLSKTKRLWTESNYLMRSSAVENISGYLGAGATGERLLANANQIGRNLGNIYSDSNAGDKFAELLRNRHTLFQNIITNAHQNKDYTDDVHKMKANTESIVQLLTQVNGLIDANKLECLLTAQNEHLVRKIAHLAKHESIASYHVFDSANKSTQELLDYLEQASWKALTNGSRY